MEATHECQPIVLTTLIDNAYQKESVHLERDRQLLKKCDNVGSVHLHSAL